MNSVFPLFLSLACSAPVAEADGETILPLSFAIDPAVYVIGAQAYTDRWGHYVTRGASTSQISDSQQVFRFIRPRYGNNARACGLNTRGNYVALARRTPPEFSRAAKVRWRWGVKKDTPRGSLGERPDDQAIQVILVFKRDSPEEYTALSFVWTKRASKEYDLYTARLPQDSFPRVQVAVRRLQNGALPPQRESVDIREEYFRAIDLHGDAFTARADSVPRLFGIVLFANSNGQRPPVAPNVMSTEAVILNLELVK